MPYIVKRSLLAVGLILGALSLVFLILYWLPGDPAALVAGPDASDATIEQLRVKLGTDKSLLQQYEFYFLRLAHGDFGTSITTGEPVVQRLLAQIPATLQLTSLGCGVAMVIGTMLGLTAAVHRGKWLDHAIQSSLLFISSMPQFWLGILMVMVFSVGLRWLPAVGSGSLEQLILPVACLGIHSSTRLARMVRNSVVDVLDAPFVATLRGKGLGERQVLYRHVLRNALMPTLTMLGMLVGELMSASVVIETLFARQGLGRLLVEAEGTKDIPMVMGVTLFVSAIYVFINLVVDISYSWIDPRIEY